MLRISTLILIPFSFLAFLFFSFSVNPINTSLSFFQEEKGVPQSGSSANKSTKDSALVNKTVPVKKPAPKLKDTPSKKPKDSLIGQHMYYLEMRGLVRKTQPDINSTQKGQLLDSVMIEVFADTNRLVAVHYSDWHGETRFRIPLFRDLRVKISKKGYFCKVLEIYTKVPPEKKAAYIFPFDIDLFEEVKGFNADRFNKPIAKIKYDAGKGNFEYDESYTNSVNHELKLLYKDYREKMAHEDPAPKK